ncbi:MAG TPA: SHOCT domain-containing protein [Dehalococcoidia bacterium]|nr:SHOCT domain-containing protein [Dehalococcoidia bacterium]
MMWDAGGWGGGWWIAMWLSMILFWGGLIALAAWLFSGIGRGGARDDRSGGEAPEETLARRLAAGEIDQEQYRAVRDELRGRHGPQAPAHGR